MITRIISAFPGTGKTYFCNKYGEKALDSDSSNFSWITHDSKKIRNPLFPANYIEYIKKNIGKYEFIFVSSYKEVRQALKENCLFFYLMYPNFDVVFKNEYIERYKNRNSSEDFVKLLSDNWYNWICECILETRCIRIELRFDYLEQEILDLIERENDK